MKILLLLCLLSTFITFINSTCTRKAPRKEGFLRTQCFPGYYEGSCLVILEKQDLHAAIEACRYDYGGRLATAPKNEAFKVWTRTIYFNHFGADAGAKYWIGYGGYGDFNYEEPDKIMANYISLKTWKRVFKRPRGASSAIIWEDDDKTDLLDDSDCPNYGTVFNSRNAKFDVKSADEEHYALCETPRWAKLQCNTGWHLIPQIRMCLEVHGMNNRYANFFGAYKTCNTRGSFISVAQNSDELDMFRNVILPYKLTNVVIVANQKRVGGFWTGIKSFGRETYTLDGTESEFIIPRRSKSSQENGCQAHYYENILWKEDDGWYNYTGLAVKCADRILPYMCQRFADQSLQVNLN